MPVQTEMQRLRRAAPCSRLSAERLVEDNRPLVHWVLGELRIYPNQDPDAYDDAHAEGLMILWRAATAYQPFRGVLFGTYATVSLRNGLLRWRGARAGVTSAGYRRPHVHQLDIKPSGQGEPEARPGTPERDCPARAAAAFEGLLARGDLTAREAEVLRRRYGSGETLGTIGAAVGLTKERVRQIEARALAKLEAALRAAGEADA